MSDHRSNCTVFHKAISYEHAVSLGAVVCGSSINITRSQSVPTIAIRICLSKVNRLSDRAWLVLTSVAVLKGPHQSRLCVVCDCETESESSPCRMCRVGGVVPRRTIPLVSRDSVALRVMYKYVPYLGNGA